jgi:hypothetical protein
MNPQNTEELSAFIDGALGKSETAFMLRRLEHDAGLRDCYTRYHLIRDCLRNPLAVAPQRGDLSARVSIALVNEPAPRRVFPWQSGMRMAAGFATAAIVAAGAFWYVQPRDPGDELASASAEPSQVLSSGVRADDLRRQLPLLPVSARQSQPLLRGEFAPQPDPETWQRAPVMPLHYPSTQYIIVLPAQRPDAPDAKNEPAQQR